MGDDHRGSRDPAGGLFVAVAVVLFGGVVVVGKIAARQGLPITSMLAVRFSIAAVALAVVLSIARRPLRAAPGEGRRLLLLGAVGYAVESALFFHALARGTAAAVSLLFYTYPVWVAALSAALGRGRPGWLLAGALTTAVAGASVVVASSGGVDITGAGILLALGAAATFSLYLLGAEAWTAGTSSLVSALWVSGAAAAALGGASAVGDRGRLPVGPVEWWGVTGMGLLTAAAFFLLFLGLRRLGAVRTSIVATLEPVATALLALGVLHEPLRPGVVGGGLLILVGAVTASVARAVPPPQAGAP